MLTCIWVQVILFLSCMYKAPSISKIWFFFKNENEDNTYFKAQNTQHLKITVEKLLVIELLSFSYKFGFFFQLGVLSPDSFLLRIQRVSLIILTAWVLHWCIFFKNRSLNCFCLFWLLDLNGCSNTGWWENIVNHPIGNISRLAFWGACPCSNPCWSNKRLSV